jgi:hypothetical protein
MDRRSKEVALVGVGPDEKGAANAAGNWTGGLQKPSGLKRPQRRSSSEAGHRRCHGEEHEVGDRILCMENAPVASDGDAARAWSLFSGDRVRSCV